MLPRLRLGAVRSGPVGGVGVGRPFGRALFGRGLFCRGLFGRALFCRALFCRALFGRALFCRGLFDRGLVGHDMDDHRVLQRCDGGDAAVGLTALAGDPVGACEHRAHRFGAALSDGARVGLAYRASHGGEPPLDEFGMSDQQPTPHRSGSAGVVGLAELHVHSACCLSEPLPRPWVVGIHHHIDQRLDSAVRQRTPRLRGVGDLGVDGRHLRCADDTVRPPRDRRHQPRPDATRQEQGIDLGEPLAQGLRQIHLRGRPPGADPQRRGDLRRRGIPRVTHPPRTLVDHVGISLVDRATPGHQLADRRQSPCRRSRFAMRPAADRADHHRIISGGKDLRISTIEHTFDTSRSL